MRVWCVGAGAIVGTVAARLTRAGVTVQVIDTNPEHVRRLRDPGLRLRSVDGDDVIPLPAHTPDATAGLDPACDLVLLAGRSQATRAALAPLTGRLGATCDVVSLQNGLNEEAIAELVGEERTVGCVVGFGATWHAAGDVELTSTGELVIGRLNGALDERLLAVGELLARALPTRTTRTIRGALWGK